MVYVYLHYYMAYNGRARPAKGCLFFIRIFAINRISFNLYGHNNLQ